MTLRQLYVRVASLPPESQVAAIENAAREKAEQQKEAGRIDAALSLIQPAQSSRNG